MGREEGGGFGMGNTCMINEIKKKKKKKKKKKETGEKSNKLPNFTPNATRKRRNEAPPGLVEGKKS